MQAIGWVAGGDCQESTEPDAWAALDAEASQVCSSLNQGPIWGPEQACKRAEAAYLFVPCL